MMDLEIRSPSLWPAISDEEDDHHHWLHRPEQICHGCRQAVHQALDAAADLKPDDMPSKTALRHRPIQASRSSSLPWPEAVPTTATVEANTVASRSVAPPRMLGSRHP